MLRTFPGDAAGALECVTAGPLDLAGRLRTLVASNASAASAYRPHARTTHGAPCPPALRGHPKHCPVCRGRFGHFRSFGLARRRNAVCPGCGSLERHRFLWLYLEDVLRLPDRRLSILHVAPEPAIRSRLAGLPHVHYLGVDLYGQHAARNMDVTRLALPDASRDVVICSHVLEHVDEDRRALDEFARVLKPGGRAIIIVPLNLRRPTLEDPGARTARERFAAFGHPYHVRICGADYGDRIASAGFTVRRIDAAVLSGHRRRYFRLNKGSLFDCRRTPGRQ